jgi:hypothetical protein
MNSAMTKRRQGRREERRRGGGGGGGGRKERELEKGGDVVDWRKFTGRLENPESSP